MYRIFQQDLIRLKLLTGKEFLKSVQAGLNPVAKTKTEAIRINAEVHGLGPRFKLTVKLQNTSTSLTPIIDLFLSFTYDENIYNLNPNYIEVCLSSEEINRKRTFCRLRFQFLSMELNTDSVHLLPVLRTKSYRMSLK